MKIAGANEIAAEATDEILKLIAEVDELGKTVELHASISRRTAEVLGKPLEGKGSSWHDIPEGVAKLQKVAEAARIYRKYQTELAGVPLDEALKAVNLSQDTTEG